MHTTHRNNVLLVGAAGAIGSALTLQLLSRASHVIAVDRSVTQLRDRVADQPDVPADQVTWIERDLDSPVSCEALIASAVSQLGQIDSLICSTGAFHVHQSAVDSRSCRMRMDSNFFVPLQLAESLLLHRQRSSERGKLKIVILSSLASQLNPPSTFDYSLAKSCLESAIQFLRNANRDPQVQFLTVRPGFVDSEMTIPFRYRPFAISADDAATRILLASDGNSASVSFPWTASWLGRIARLSPGIASKAFEFCLRPKDEPPSIDKPTPNVK